MPANLFETTNVQIAGEKGAQIGIKLTGCLVVTEVNHASISHMKLNIGDIIQSVNGQRVERREQFTEMFVKTTNAGSFVMDIVMQRPLTAKPVKPEQIPRGYEIVSGCKYHLGIMYKIPGCKLSLSVKAFMSKVFVTRTEDCTLAGLTLKIGDAILDIEGQPVSTVQETSEALFKALKKGYAFMVIEQPVELVNKNIVRQALTTDRSTEPPVQRDVVGICKSELRRFNENPDMNPPKEILRDDKKSKRGEPGHVSVSDKSEDVPIACDGNPALLMSVPIPNFQIASQQATPSNQQK
uniref:PDZ domain-containing protein n=1 Tax=Panagrellus redivivus TaxID=6233 RepID=A0A7E4ZW52_PANRE